MNGWITALILVLFAPQAARASDSTNPDATEIGTIAFSNESSVRQSYGLRRCGPDWETERLKVGPRGKKRFNLTTGESWTVDLPTGCYILHLDTGYRDGYQRFFLRPKSQGILRHHRGADDRFSKWEIVSNTVYFGAPH